LGALATSASTKNSLAVGSSGERRDARRRGDQDEAQVVAERGEQIAGRRAGLDRDLGLQRRPEAALGAERLDLLVRFRPHGGDSRPLGEQRLVLPRARVAVDLGEDRGRVLGPEHLPRFLGGEAEEGRHPAQHRVADVPERGLRRSARARRRRRRVEAVLEDVEVERAEVFRAEHLQLGDDRMEFVGAEVAAAEDAARRIELADDLRLQRGRAGEHPAVDLEHVGERDGVARGIEVARVGEQEAQGVPDAPVGVDDAGQDLVVDGEVARVVGRRAPEADDLGAELGGDLVQGDEVAQALAHLAARAVDGEAVREEAAIGRVALDRAGDQERRVEPAAMLVVASR
jgi:hypothetical protein